MVRREKRRQVKCSLPRETPDVLRQLVLLLRDTLQFQVQAPTQVKGIWIKTK
jgi:hypothetical protein